MNTNAKPAVTVLKNLPCPRAIRPQNVPNANVPMWKSSCQQAVLDLRVWLRDRVALPLPPASRPAEEFNCIP